MPSSSPLKVEPAFCNNSLIAVLDRFVDVNMRFVDDEDPSLEQRVSQPPDDDCPTADRRQIDEVAAEERLGSVKPTNPLVVRLVRESRPRQRARET